MVKPRSIHMYCTHHYTRFQHLPCEVETLQQDSTKILLQYMMKYKQQKRTGDENTHTLNCYLHPLCYVLTPMPYALLPLSSFIQLKDMKLWKPLHTVRMAITITMSRYRDGSNSSCILIASAFQMMHYRKCGNAW